MDRSPFQISRRISRFATGRTFRTAKSSRVSSPKSVISHGQRRYLSAGLRLMLAPRLKEPSNRERNMGTSQSSKGAPPKVPIVPPWVPPVPAPAPAPAGNAPPGSEAPQATAPAAAVQAPAPSVARRIPLAPAGRFSAARRAAGSFAEGGGTAQLRRSLGHYVRKGYGGAKTTTERFGGTIGTADTLYGALTPRAPGAGAVPLDRELLASRSAAEIIDAVVEAVQPGDGTLDPDASRAAIKDALSELLVKYPDADLLELTEEQREFTVERFIAMDVFQRYALDIWKTIQDKAPSVRNALRRLKEVKEYVNEAVAARFRALRAAGQVLSGGRVKQFVQAVLLETFQVFEHYTE